MPLLFSYGTLRDRAVQLATFGRTLQGEPDALTGYEESHVAIADPSTIARLGRTHHANVRFTGGTASVRGIVFDVTEADLVRADEFEAPYGYRRVIARLISGREAWVYAHDPHSLDG